MTIPFDTSPPTTRPNVVSFNTDDANTAWLEAMKEATDLDRSLIIHRIVTQAREAAARPHEGERRGEDRRKVS